MKKWIVDYMWTTWHLMFMLLFMTFAVVSLVIGKYVTAVAGAVFFTTTLVDLCLKIAAFKRFKKRQEESKKL